jgi:hypothetical protein
MELVGRQFIVSEFWVMMVARLIEYSSTTHWENLMKNNP